MEKHINEENISKDKTMKKYGKTLKEQFYNYVKIYDYVSFAELKKKAPDWFNGRIAIESIHYKNIYLWFDVSQEFFQAFSELLTEDKIILEPCSEFVYICDGEIPNPKIKTAKKAQDYKTKRWIPTTIRAMSVLTEKEKKEFLKKRKNEKNRNQKCNRNTLE